MGFELATWRVSATLSRHNSARDDEHDALWADMIARLQAIINEPKYEPITPFD